MSPAVEAKHLIGQTDYLVTLNVTDLKRKACIYVYIKIHTHVHKYIHAYFSEGLHTSCYTEEIQVSSRFR